MVQVEIGLFSLKRKLGKRFLDNNYKAPVRRLLREFDALLANMESKLGQAFFANALYQTLCIHLTQSASEQHKENGVKMRPRPEKEDRSPLPIMAMPTSGEVFFHHQRLLKILKMWKADRSEPQ